MNKLTFLLYILIFIFLIICFSSCNAIVGQPAVSVLEDELGNRTSIYLPYKIKWMTPLFPDEDAQDHNRPVEDGSPVIAGERVFVGSHFGTLMCIHRKTGHIIWKFQAYGGIESTPAIYKENVIVGDSDGNVYSLRLNDGHTNWTYKVQGEVMGEIALHDNIAMFTTTYNAIYALNADDGSWIWTHKRALPEEFTVRGVSTPVTDGKLVFAGLADGYLIAVDIQRGKEVWKSLLNSGERLLDVDAQPLLDGDLIYIPSFDGSLYCLKKEDGEMKWKFGMGGANKVTIGHKAVYFSGNLGFIYAVDKKNGKEIWKFDMREQDQRKSATESFRKKTRVPTSPVLIGEFLLSVSSYGYFYVLDPDDGKVLWRYLPGYGVSSEIVSAGREIYFLSNSAFLFKMEPSQAPRSYIP